MKAIFVIGVVRQIKGLIILGRNITGMTREATVLQISRIRL